MDEADTIDVGPAPDAQPVEDPSRPGSSRTRALARAGITVTILFLLSRILGYLRYVIIANAVPNPSQLDSFFAAFRIPDFLFQLVAAGALSSALIPVIAGLFATEQEARAWRVVSTVTTLMLGALLVLAGVVLLVAPQLVAFITPGFDPAELALTTDLTRIMVLSPMFLAAGAVATSALNARGRFGAAALAPLVYNIAIIAGAIVLVPLFGISGLAASVVLGAAGHVLVQLPSLARIGARIRPRLELGDAEARKALVLMAPRALGLGATQVVFLVMTGLASTLGEGSIAVFNFAFAVLQIPIGVIGVPLGVVLLPSLSREAATGGTEAFRRLLVRGLSMLGFVMIAIAALGIVVSEDVTRLLFDYGSIGDSALELTAVTLAVFLLGLTAHALIAVVARAFYALQDTATPVAAALLAVVVNIVAANVLVGPYGVAGLAGAIALAAWLELVALVILLQRRLPGVGLGHVAVVMAKALVASIAGGFAAWLVYEALLGAWGQDPGFLLLLARTTLTTICGGVVILGASAALRIEELRTIVGLVVDLLRRKGRA
ncbi:MAG TPA: murein biosynthesis integral membrane protein MurJ [Candidatus Limnocylindrales bacterium]|jgi:putative peptidoglycan lipid II flippase